MIIPLKSRFLQLSEEEFFLFCQEMRDFRIERDGDGTILITLPAIPLMGYLNAAISSELGIWNRKAKLGVAFGSNTGFTFPNKAVRSPDSAWIEKERWQAISQEDRKRFAHVVPDFVIEIRSESDLLGLLKDKMQEYIEHGVRLGWLIDPLEEQVWIYRGHGTIDQLIGFNTPLSGEDVLQGFELQLSNFWPPEA